MYPVCNRLPLTPRHTASSSCTLYYQNVRSLNNKLPYLKSNTYQLIIVPGIIVFTETWLKPHTESTELGLSNYNIYRYNRNFEATQTTRGGEVLVAIKKGFMYNTSKHTIL